VNIMKAKVTMILGGTVVQTLILGVITMRELIKEGFLFFCAFKKKNNIHL
jgi:hypothetical protein